MSETLSVEKLQAQVDQVKIDLDSLKKESSDDIIKTKTTALETKVTTTKDNITKKIDELKALGEASHSAEIAKLEKMLALLTTSTSDLTDLKKDVADNSSPDTDKKDDKKNDKKDDKKNTDKNWFKRQIDGFTDSTEEHHALKNTARIAWGIGILALGIRGVKKLFGMRKNKKEATTTTDKISTTDNPAATTSPTDTADEKKTSFGSKVWKVLKYGWLAVGWFFWLKWLVGKEWWYKDILDWVGIRNRAEAPAVTADDATNTITWLVVGMEYSTDDGKTYTAYDASNIPTFPGVKKVLVRVAKTDTVPESKTKELAFTAADAGPTVPWYEAEYEKLDEWKKTQYTALDKNVALMYSDTIKSVSPDMHLPPLLIRKDDSLSTWSSYSSIMYMLDENYGTMDKVLHDDYFSKVEQKTDLVLSDVVDFLKKYKDNKIVGGICTTIASWLDTYLAKWSFDEVSLKKKLEDDPNALAQLKVLIKKISITRFFVSEKRKIYEAKLEKEPDMVDKVDATLTDTFDGVRFVGTTESDISLYSTLKDNSTLDATISAETETGIELNKEAQELQSEIAATASNIDYSWQRWNIIFDYKTNTLKSRNKSTEIEVLAGEGLSILGKIDWKNHKNAYRIKDLPIKFEYLDSLVWVANYINNMMYTYGDNILSRMKNTVSRNCLNWHNWYGPRWIAYPWIYEDASFFGVGTVDTDRVLSKDALYEACPSWWDDEAEALVAYLNKRFTKLAG